MINSIIEYYMFIFSSCFVREAVFVLVPTINNNLYPPRNCHNHFKWVLQTITYMFLLKPARNVYVSLFLFSDSFYFVFFYDKQELN